MRKKLLQLSFLKIFLSSLKPKLIIKLISLLSMKFLATLLCSNDLQTFYRLFIQTTRRYHFDHSLLTFFDLLNEFFINQVQLFKEGFLVLGHLIKKIWEGSYFNRFAHFVFLCAFASKDITVKNNVLAFLINTDSQDRISTLAFSGQPFKLALHT